MRTHSFEAVKIFNYLGVMISNIRERDTGIEETIIICQQISPCQIILSRTLLYAAETLTLVVVRKVLSTELGPVKVDENYRIRTKF